MIPCPACGAAIDSPASHCPSCGADLVVAAAAPARRPLGLRARSALPRLVVYGLLAALPVAGALRVRTTGPGPDLKTTVRWAVLGDDGRAATLVTLHRAHEIAAAAARFAVGELATPSFEGDWAPRLAPYSTMAIRGWIPLLFEATDTQLAPGAVRVFFEIRSTDGWGRPYRISARTLAAGPPEASDPEVSADLAAGLSRSFFSAGRPDLAATDWLRLALTSDGPDGRPDSGDEITFISYIPLGHTFRVGADADRIRRQMNADLIRGRHYFRYTGSRWDLIDARLLAEYRLEMIAGAGS